MGYLCLNLGIYRRVWLHLKQVHIIIMYLPASYITHNLGKYSANV